MTVYVLESGYGEFRIILGVYRSVDAAKAAKPQQEWKPYGSEGGWWNRMTNRSLEDPVYITPYEVQG